MNKLQCQTDGSEWSFDNINSLSWAIGSISGVLNEDLERNFLIMTVKVIDYWLYLVQFLMQTLLNLVDLRSGKKNKAVVASNIMYVVGQYQRFLRSNWTFLKTVIKKLFEFMKEEYQGVMVS